jgi:hypothetical protein
MYCVHCWYKCSGPPLFQDSEGIITEINDILCESLVDFHGDEAKKNLNGRPQKTEFFNSGNSH